MPPATPRTTPLLRPALAGALLALVAVAAALVAMSIDRAPTAAAGAANLRALAPFWIASAAGWGFLGLLAVALLRAPRGGPPIAARRFRRQAVVVLLVALAARGAVLVGHDPALSDDIHRYVFDGRNAAHGINPYLVAPEERRGEAERWTGESAVVELVNNPELHTIYLPTSQIVFALAGTIAPESSDDPAALARAFRAVFVLFELLAMLLLLPALRHLGRPAWWLALYAWHPLALAEIAGSGHQDAIGLPLVVLALLLYTVSPRRLLAGVAAIAVAVLVKPVVLPVAALLLRGRDRRVWTTALVVGAVVTAGLLLPLLLGDAAAIANLRATGERFALKWAHFGSVYEPVLRGIESLAPGWTNDPQEQLARAVCTALLALVVLGLWLRGRDAWRDASLVFLAMVLLTPAAHPWYLLWALVLVPVAPTAGVWVASLTLPWGYAVLGDTIDWTTPAWLLPVAFAPVYAALAADFVAQRRRSAERPAR